jgi:hypothetical protein
MVLDLGSAQGQPERRGETGDIEWRALRRRAEHAVVVSVE